jgi:hypothetical protein
MAAALRMHVCRAFGSDITVVHLLAAYVASVVPAALELTGQQATLAAARKEGPLKQGELPDLHGPAAAVSTQVPAMRRRAACEKVAPLSHLSSLQAFLVRDACAMHASAASSSVLSAK